MKKKKMIKKKKGFVRGLASKKTKTTLRKKLTKPTLRKKLTRCAVSISQKNQAQSSETKSVMNVSDHIKGVSLKTKKSKKKKPKKKLPCETGLCVYLQELEERQDELERKLDKLLSLFEDMIGGMKPTGLDFEDVEGTFIRMIDEDI